jgi:hypothetical protein
MTLVRGRCADLLIAKVAAARRLLTLVYYGMRDGHIRCLATPGGSPPAALQTQTA